MGMALSMALLESSGSCHARCVTGTCCCCDCCTVTTTGSTLAPNVMQCANVTRAPPWPGRYASSERKSATPRLIQCGENVGTSGVLSEPRHSSSDGSSMESTNEVEWPVELSSPARSKVL